MRYIIPLLVPLILLSSCSIDWNGEKNFKSQSSQTPQATTPSESSMVKNLTSSNMNQKDFGSGFILSQTNDESTLSYSGKLVKTWSHTPPEKVPFIWDEACSIVWGGFEKLPPSEQSTGKQGVWDRLSSKEKIDCMKEDFGRTIRIEATKNPRFYLIIKTQYEGTQQDIVDIQTGKTYILTQSIVDNILILRDTILVQTSSNYDASDELFIFSKEFTLQKKWTASGNQHTTIEKIDSQSETGIILYLKDFDYKTQKESYREEDIQTKTTPPKAQEPKISTGETIKDFGNGFIFKNCNLYLKNDIVQEYSMIGCSPSEKIIQEHIISNIPEPFIIGNIQIELPRSLSMIRGKTSFTNFEDYAKDIETNLILELVKQNQLSKEEIQKELQKLKGHYSFERKNINGVDILIHKRDFYGTIGSIYEAYILTGNGETITLSDEFYHSKIDNALNTLKKSR